jgi:hypothetical protein
MGLPLFKRLGNSTDDRKSFFSAGFSRGKLDRLFSAWAAALSTLPDTSTNRCHPSKSIVFFFQFHFTPSRFAEQNPSAKFHASIR